MSDHSPTFEADIKPLFRDSDRGAMTFAFDLWDYEEVKENAEGIATRLEDGTMPCDGAWPPAQVETFRAWIAAGCPS
ncbi:MAG TPA: hypothetical protein VGB83_12210 [Actinomycetota bacterium]